MAHDSADIRQVDFGRLDAESDPNLASFFLDTGVVDRIARGQRKFVIGRKGSGKTAIFREAKIPGVQIIRLDFESYAWDAHKAIRELGMNPESAYVASWIFTFLVSACREWAKSPKPHVREAAKKYTQRFTAQMKAAQQISLLTGLSDFGGSISPMLANSVDLEV